MPEALTSAHLDRLSAFVTNTKIPKHLRDRAQALLDAQAEAEVSKIEQEGARRSESLRLQLAATKEMEDKVAERQRKCSHKKRNIMTGALTSLLRGQAMNEGTVVLTCQVCGKMFSDPARPSERWDLIPRDLWPEPGEVGAIIDPNAQLRAARLLHRAQNVESPASTEPLEETQADLLSEA